MSNYIHTISNDVFANIMLHNTRLRKGYLPTGDALESIWPEGCIISPYSSFTNEQEKEEKWETVRKKEFPNLPSRKNALFLFDDKNSLEAAMTSWWSGQKRLELTAQIPEGAKIHKADAKLLDCNMCDYDQNAHAYWSGDTTDKPIFEIVVQGIVFFPDWESFPMLSASGIK